MTANILLPLLPVMLLLLVLVFRWRGGRIPILEGNLYVRALTVILLMGWAYLFGLNHH